MPKSIYYYNSPISRLGIADDGEAITNIFLPYANAPEDFVVKETPLIKEAVKQLSEYFSGKRKVFDLPVKYDGTTFIKKVYSALQAIPYGETRTYKQIAESTGIKRAYRAVGMVNHRNPIPIIIPCHRVIGSNGQMTGYAGGIDVKVRLIELERKNSALGSPERTC